MGPDMSIAYVFPGQGSQSVGMLSTLADEFGEVQQTFAAASEVLGEDLWELVQNGPDEKLNQTTVTQPAMLAAGVATWRCARTAGLPRPEWLAGHSLGEYSALVAAGVLDFEIAVSLVEFRAKVMQEAVAEGEGAMAAVLGLDDQQVRDLCAQAAKGEVVEAVNFNAPGQVVIAGTAAAVERACELMKGAGARRCIELPVSVPSHCALMRPAAERLGERLEAVTFSPAEIRVLHNVNVATSANAGEMREALTRQLYSPVRWVETVQKMRAEGVAQVVECGPGKVLAGLNRRIDRTLTSVALTDPQAIAQLAALTSEETP